jgi:hypothetical protein
MNKKARISIIKFATFCFLSFFLSSSQAEVTLTVGKSSADPSATDIPVAVSLENQDDQVKALQVDVCDVDDYLTCTACETTDRTADFTCMASEITTPDNPLYGCCKVVLLSLNANEDIIEAGEGAIFTINYDVSNEAPSDCRELTTENAIIIDENRQSLVIITEPGGFCFHFLCNSQADCDDGLFCNGVESCEDDTCVHSGDACSPDLVCDEKNDECVECLRDADCDEGVFCNEDTHSCEPAITTTISSTTTTPPVPPSTTTTILYIYGHVVDSEGNGIQSIPVYLETITEDKNKSTLTNTDGYFQFPDLKEPMHYVWPESVHTYTPERKLVELNNQPVYLKFVQIDEGCPITRIYGKSSKEANALRALRDSVLKNDPVGRKLIHLYYDYNPMIIKMLNSDEAFKKQVKEMIDEVLELIGEIE